MIMWTLGLLMFTTMLLLVNSNNPMKASFMLLVSSSLMFMILKMKMGTVWMPMIFFILSTGGILMMFMILSSVLPNEKALKMKISKWGFITSLLLIFGANHKGVDSMNLAPQMKSFLSTSMLFLLMMSVILIYFFGSVNLNSSEDTSLRSVQC